MKYKISNISTESEFLFFWGHQPSKDGSIIKSCFSQWWISEFVEDKISYYSAEQYMMAKKAVLFHDIEIQNLIIETNDPKECKKLGRKVSNFDEELWNANKYEIVKQANFLKFSQNISLKEFLMGTGQKVIVEASPYDRVWGIGLTQDNPKASNPMQWNGENLLGFVLMEVRDTLLNKKQAI